MAEHHTTPALFPVTLLYTCSCFHLSTSSLTFSRHVSFKLGNVMGILVAILVVQYRYILNSRHVFVSRHKPWSALFAFELYPRHHPGWFRWYYRCRHDLQLAIKPSRDPFSLIGFHECKGRQEQCRPNLMRSIGRSHLSMLQEIGDNMHASITAP